MSYRLSKLAELVQGRVEGDPDLEIDGLRSLARAGPRHLSFLTHRRYREEAEKSRAGALLVGAEGRLAGRVLLVVEEPYLALARLLAALHPEPRPQPGVHSTAIVAAGAEVAVSAAVGAYSLVGEGSRVEEEAWIHPHVVVGRGCSVGPRAVLYPHVVLYDGCRVEEGSIVHAGVVLGSDGFGYAQDGGTHVKLRHVGSVVVEPEVEIGANSAVDRGLLEETRLGAGSKIDNLVQIAHNVELGRGCLLISQAGIAGSTRLGDGVVMAGQTGAAGHLVLGDGVQVLGKSAVFQSVEKGRRVAGIPAIEAAAWRRQQALARRLEEMRRRIRRLEQRLRRLEESGGE